MEDCVFCMIISGEMATEFVYQDDKIAAFKNINPEAPVHILVVPKTHIADLNQAEDTLLLGEMLDRIVQIAKDLNLADRGYKVVINVGKDGGQVISHLHFHLLGGWKGA